MTKLPSTTQIQEYRSQLLTERPQSILSLAEILEIGREMFGSENHISIYGMCPSMYYNLGVRIAGRTAVECIVDRNAAATAQAVRRILGEIWPVEKPFILDLCTGSGNLLFHMSRLFGATPVLGIESDSVVYELTRRNFELIGFGAKLRLGSFQSLFSASMLPSDRPSLILVNPPWGSGFSFQDGLDISATEPPIRDILELVMNRAPTAKGMFLIPVSRLVNESSINNLTKGFRTHRRSTLETEGAGFVAILSERA